MESNLPSSRLQQQQQQQQEVTATEGAQRQSGQTSVEFATPEAMLRHDRASVPPPASVEARLKQSIAAEPAAPQPWWKRWFGR